MSKEEVNEFEDFSEESFTPEASNSEVPNVDEDMIAHGNAGQEYDIDKAPDTTKAPPRISMDGQETVIKDMKLIIPDASRPWIPSKSGTTKYKYCTFKLFYDNGQIEFISGVRVFPRMEKSVEKYSDPSITTDRVSQASNLMGLYADYKGKDIKEISLREFLSYLRSGCKVVIKGVPTINPKTNETITKNLVSKFI